MPSRAVLSHITAARLWGFKVPGSYDIHLTTPNGRHLGREGVVIHRTRNLGTHEWCRRDGLPVTTLVRTTLDLASTVDAFNLRAMVEACLKSAPMHFDLLDAGSRPGMYLEGGERLQSLLAEYADLKTSDSMKEAFMREVTLHVGRAPVQHFQIDLGAFSVHPDFVWPEIKFIVEVDGYSWHSSQQDLSNDHERDRLLQSRGFMVTRYMAKSLRDPKERERIMIEITRLIAARVSSREPRQGNHAG